MGFAKADKLNGEALERIAEVVLEALSPEFFRGNAPLDIEYVLDVKLNDYKTSVVYTDMPDGCEGSSALGERRISISRKLYESSKAALRRRFRSTAAHEIGHLFLHKIFPEMVPSWRGLYLPRSDDKITEDCDPEKQAWRFAQAFVMPRHLFIPAFQKVKHMKDYMKELANMFDVNPAFVRSRIKTLKLKRS